MKSCRVIIGISIIAILFIIGIPTFLTIKDTQKNKVSLVLNNQIKDAARKCYNESKCINNTVTLKELYNYNYLDKLIYHDTKEFVNENSYVTRTNDEISVTLVN